MTKKEILELVEQEDVEFIRLQFTDIFSNLKNVAVTAAQFEKVLDHKYAFDGSAVFDGFYQCEDDYYLYPDLSTFVVLPWRPQQGKVARLLCDIYDEKGQPISFSPRAVLKAVMGKAKGKGYEFIIDPECEFFLFESDEDGIPTTVSHEDAGYMAVGPTDSGENARRDMVLSLEQMGFAIESSLHEKAPAQHEIVFSGADALTIADSIITFRSAVRSIARRFGLHASFMPKPKKGVAGSGMHLHISMKAKGEDLFDCNENGCNENALNFMGGIMKHVKGLCGISNPLVNSYKRINTGFESPKEISWGYKNRNQLLRIYKKPGECTKIELRFPDSAANPYLTIALCIMAGMDGMEQKISAEEKNLKGYLPGTLKEAINFMNEDSFIKDVLGNQLCSIYTEAKTAEWNEYMEEVSDWEVSKYLNRI